MKYLEPAEARDLPGLRLALTRGVPAPYSMSARAVLDLRGVPYQPVAQYGAGANEELVAWTGHRNAPVAVYENEAPRVGWLEILNLAERLGSGASLVPEKPSERMTMFGLINELIGENGWVWNMRLVMLGAGGPERAAKEATRNPMYAAYGYSEPARERALDRAAQALDALVEQVRAQHQAGSAYIIGDRLSAADVYWAYFSLILQTLPHEDCPMPEGLRKSYDYSGAQLGDVDACVIVQRDHTFAEHLPLPMTF